MISKPITFEQIFGFQMPDGTIIDSIEIPIIQRDYAQGRKTKEVNRIRDSFVKAIYESLIGDENNSIKLDFVYGNVEEGKLIPLDGQQRLTTLFLLHWYLAKHDEVDDYSFLEKFTYKTRFSSQHFCQKLIDCWPNLDVDELSEWIKDQHWFMYSWENDPTINSMLVMIDELHSTFNGHYGLWEKLIDKNNPPISFYFLPLEEMGVTDSIYIKMNSRGKPLTPFEHFKAEFEKIVLGVSNELHSVFITKVDVDWVDMFWRYRGFDDVIDDEFLRFYRFITEILCYEQEIDLVENDFDLAYRVYGKTNESAFENLTTLFNSFDSWLKLNDISEFFDTIFGNEVHENDKVLLFSEENNLFHECCHLYGEFLNKRRLFSLNSMILLFAIQKYLLNKDFIRWEDFKNRLRIIRNLVFNSQFEIREARIPGLLKDTAEIILQGSIPLKTNGFSEIQKQQEVEKIQWREDHPDLVQSLNKLEDNYLLQGNVAIIGLDETNDFEVLTNNFNDLFNGKTDFLTISSAMLTVGDYAQLIGVWRFSFGNSTESVWKEIFQVSRRRQFFDRTKKVLKELLLVRDTNIVSHIDNLITHYLEDEPELKDWKYYLIKYPRMREGKSGIFYWYEDPNRMKENQYKVHMMNTPQTLNGRHWSPFLYELSKDSELENETTLEEYGAPLYLIKRNQYLKCENSFWGIYNENDELVEKVEIPQENDTDLVDRIELIKNFFIDSLN